MAFNCGVLLRSLHGQDHEGGRERQRDRGQQLLRHGQADLDLRQPEHRDGQRLLGPERLRLLHLAAQVPGHVQLVGAVAADRDAGAGDDRVHARRGHDRGRRRRRGCRVPVSALACDEANPAVAFEFWSEHVVGSGSRRDLPVLPLGVPVHACGRSGTTPSRRGRPSRRSTASPRRTATGATARTGTARRTVEDISEGGFWATADALPTAECAAQAVTAIS